MVTKAIRGPADSALDMVEMYMLCSGISLVIGVRGLLLRNE
ncbi:hypothetical protein [Megasphaera cerevisiae]|nr:hypothetical protein [Megasphaera cerevisiae]